MTTAPLVEDRPGFNDLDLMRSLKGRRLSGQLRCLYVIGAHRFDEKSLVDQLFPFLQTICVFEPLPEPRAVLEAMARCDPRLRVFPNAIADFDAPCEFQVTSNDGESSSLLKLGTHAIIFPHVTVLSTITVQARRLSTLIREHDLPPPDALIVDVQGAEYRVLSSIDGDTLAGIRLIYTEVSTEAVYENSRTLAEVEALLAPRFANLGYAPLTPDTPMHGNAVFVRKEDVQACLELRWDEQARRIARTLRRGLARLRRSASALRKGVQPRTRA